MDIKRIFLFLTFASIPVIGLGQKANLADSTCAICLNHSHPAGPPYNFSVKRELPYLAAGIGMITASFVLQSTNQISPYTYDELALLDRNDVNPFDRPATYRWNPEAAIKSDYFRTTVVLLPVFFLANHHTRKDFGALLVMALEVGVINYGLTAMVKNIANRYRPFVYNDNAPIEERSGEISLNSFYSGHASHTAAFSFFMAKVISDYHPGARKGFKIGIWTFAAVIPAITGYLRFTSGKHYPTDIMTGYLLGAATGIIIPQLHKKPLFKNTALSLFPVFYAGSSGLGLNLEF